MDVFIRRKKLQGISVYSVFTWKEKSQGISVDSTNDGNNCTTKKVNWKQTERQTDLLCEFLQRNTDLNYTLMLMMFTNFRKFLLIYSIKAPFLILKSSFPLLMNSVKIACFFALLLLDPCT